MWIISITILSAISTIFCANILILNEVISPSHHIFDYALASGLIAKGHNVTMFGVYADKNQNTSNYHPITTKGVHEELHTEVDILSSIKINPIESILFLLDFTKIECELVLKNPAIQQLLNYPKDFKFDLIVNDITLSPCLNPFIKRFNYPPTIGITAYLLPQYLSYEFGNKLQPSYIPWQQIDFTDDMNFIERVQNFIFTYTEIALKYYHEVTVIEDLQRKTFGEDTPSISELNRHISLILSNINPVFNHPQPIPPNIIPIGGLHVRPAGPLPNDLQAIIKKAENGVIVFSLGSNFQSDQLSPNIQQAILNTFAKLPYTILWKFESDLKNVPENVVIRKWLPINDILGQSNTKLFITHGGALSSQESMYHGVPIVGMPLFVDQHTTVQSMVKRKLGDYININELTSELFFEKITNILNNEHIYKKNMETLSKRYKDLPETSLERAVFWAEYAIKHNGADFLNPKSRDLSLIVMESIDVIAFLVLVIVVSLTLVVYIIGKIVVCLLKQRRKTKTD